jgi:hypothetical protein
VEPEEAGVFGVDSVDVDADAVSMIAGRFRGCAKGPWRVATCIAAIYVHYPSKEKVKQQAVER